MPDPKEPNQSDVQELAFLRRNIEALQYNVVCIPENFPGAEDIRRNIELYLQRGGIKAAHLIMLLRS